MNIEAITVCVDYVDLLKFSIGKWLRELDRLVVVTSPRDEATIQFCRKCKSDKLICHTTDLFYANGASFNKGAAMEEALSLLDGDDWILFFDSDIQLVNPNLRSVIAEHAQMGALHGAPRFQVHNVGGFRRGEAPEMTSIPDLEIAGYFQLFHASDPRVCDSTGKLRRPLLSTHWKHAGNYDSDFQHLWDEASKRRIPFPLLHLGEFNQNWFGLADPHRQEKIQAMFEERRQRAASDPASWLDGEKLGQVQK
jgi:hypothetical protein